MPCLDEHSIQCDYDEEILDAVVLMITRELVNIGILGILVFSVI